MSWFFIFVINFCNYTWNTEGIEMARFSTLHSAQTSSLLTLCTLRVWKCLMFIQFQKLLRGHRSDYGYSLPQSFPRFLVNICTTVLHHALFISLPTHCKLNTTRYTLLNVEHCPLHLKLTNYRIHITCCTFLFLLFYTLQCTVYVLHPTSYTLDCIVKGGATRIQHELI